MGQEKRYEVIFHSLMDLILKKSEAQFLLPLSLAAFSASVVIATARRSEPSGGKLWLKHMEVVNKLKYFMIIKDLVWLQCWP